MADLFFRRDKNGIIVTTGHILRSSRFAEKENTYQEFTLEAIIDHPSKLIAICNQSDCKIIFISEFDSVMLVNDISIIKVKNGFLWSQAVQPACLPTKSINIELEIHKDQTKSPVCVVSGKSWASYRTLISYNT